MPRHGVTTSRLPRRLLVLTVEHVTLGHVLDEQQPRPDATGFDLAAFSEQRPTVVAGIKEYFAGGRTADDLFHDCVRLVVAQRPKGEE